MSGFDPSPGLYPHLVAAARAFNDVAHLPDLLGTIRERVTRTVDADAVSLLWLSEDGRTGSYLMLYDEIRWDHPVVVDAPTRRFVADVIADRAPRVLGDLSTDPSYVPRYSAECGYPVGPMVVVPMVHAGVLRGVLEVSRRSGREPFDADAIAFLEAVGEDIVMSLSNAFLHHERRDLIAENELLYEISLDLGRAMDVETLLERLLDQLQRLVRYDAAGIYLVDPRGDALEWLEHRGYPPGAQHRLALKLGRGLVGLAAAEGKPVLVDDVLTHPSYVTARPETRSELVVPFRGAEPGHDAVVGAFNIESDRPAAFGRRDLHRLEAFAAIASVAVARERTRRLREAKRRIDGELALARRIQRLFQPRRMPLVTGIELWGEQRTSFEMSGDYHDVIRVSPNDVGLVVADVSGKGVPAALIMASVRAGLLSEVRNTYGISEIMGELNHLLYDSTDDMAFVTAFYGVLNTADRRLTFVNAGHNPPLLLRRSGEVEWLSTGGTILGAFPDATYLPAVRDLHPGDALVMYTDGFTEATAPDDEEEVFDEPRLLAAVRGAVSAPSGDDPGSPVSARAIGEAVIRAVQAFSPRETPEDDQTILVLRVPEST